jgi:modification methylase
MHTYHKIYYKDSRNLKDIEADSIHLVVTSPPYPMIAMWDEIFLSMNSKIGNHLKSGDGFSAFKLMHVELRKTWEAIFKILIPGGHVCINIGDATRTIDGQFKLYPNHSEIVKNFYDIGFTVLPEIIWRKPSNSPTKFLGSGMLPCGGYVTLEHEYILIFRKPQKRKFKSNDEIHNRRQSSFFWEERNKWFSDIWELNGIRQTLNEKEIRKRSGAYPFEIPFRLINMFSSKLDTILDPFLGTATTTLAAIICGRNSIGYELDKGFNLLHRNEIPSSSFIKIATDRISNRINDHNNFIADYQRKGGKPKYKSSQYGFPLITKQEIEIKFETIDEITLETDQNIYKAKYKPFSI